MTRFPRLHSFLTGGTPRQSSPEAIGAPPPRGIVDTLRALEGNADDVRRDWRAFLADLMAKQDNVDPEFWERKK